MENSIKTIINSTLADIAAAQKLSPYAQNVRLVAISKTKPAEMVQEAYDAGQRHFGENYVDEIAEKSPVLPQDIKWHFVGHLQSNKVNKVIVPNLWCIETVDSIKLVKKINQNCDSKNMELNVMIQLKTSDEDTKNGVSEDEAMEITEFVLNDCKRLQFLGYMTIGEAGDMEAFTRTRKAKERAVEKFGLKSDEIELSMGMTADYVEAIKSGSNNIRVGSKIFGARAPKVV